MLELTEGYFGLKFSPYTHNAYFCWTKFWKNMLDQVLLHCKKSTFTPNRF